MWPLGCEGVTAPGTREGSHSDARGDLPEAWASAPHRDAAAAAGRVSLFLPADLPLCDFSLVTYLHGPCQISAQPRPSSKPIGPQESNVGHPDTSRPRET